MTIDALIEQEIISAVQELYGATVDSKSVQISDTKKEIAGDKTVVIFPLVRISKNHLKIQPMNLVRIWFLTSMQLIHIQL